ncbi:MAG: LysR family transcriptional regulator [Alphaproteobacteria bacterium]
MPLYHFEILATVARLRNLTRASAELHISQPALTQQLKNLERKYNSKLYKKGGKGVELTDAGKILLKYVKRILKQHESVKRRLSAPTALNKAQSLTVGGSYSPSAVLLPSLLARFRKSHPQVELNLRTENRLNIERLILKGEVELAVVSNPPSNHRLASEPYHTQPLVAFVASHHPLSGKNQLTLEDLRRHGFVVRRPSGGEGPTAQFIRRLKDQGVKLKVVMYCESPEAVKVAVSRRMGVGILFKDVVADSLRKGEIKELTLPVEGLEGTSFIVYHKTRSLSPVASDFLNVHRAHRARFKRKEQIRVGSMD